jgi:hypothetical protein
MKSTFNFENLTIRELLVEILGEKDAGDLLQTIQKAIKDDISGEELKKLIHAKLCELKVTRIEVYELLHIVPHIVAPHIVMPADKI